MREPVILFEEATVRIGAHQNLLLVAWRDAPTVVQLREFGRIARDFERKKPGRCALWNVVIGGTPSFNDEVRRQLAELMSERFLTLGTAHVILVGGFAGATARALINTAILMSRANYPRRAFDDPRQAALWMSPRLGSSPPPRVEELLAVHDAFVGALSPA
jgi:hypothetical protein